MSDVVYTSMIRIERFGGGVRRAALPVDTWMRWEGSAPEIRPQYTAAYEG